MQFFARLDEKRLTSWEVITLSQVVNVGSAVVGDSFSLVEQVAEVSNYQDMAVEESGLPFMREKEADIGQDMMLSDFLHGMSALTYRQYVCVRNGTLRHLCLLDVVKNLNQGFPSSQCSGVTARDDLGFLGCDQEPALFLVRDANAFTHQKNAVAYAKHFYYSALLFLNQVRKGYEFLGKGLLGIWVQFLAMELPHTKSLTLSFCTMLFNTLG